MQTNKINKLLLLGLLLAICPAVSGQIVFGEPTWGSLQFMSSSWTIEDTLGQKMTVSQSYFPLTGFIPLQDNLEAQVYVAQSSSSLEFIDFDNSVSGISDLRIQVNKSVKEDQILLSAGLNLPIGKKKLSLEDEWQIIELLSQDFLDIPLRRFGDGFGFNMLVGGARQFGTIRVGGGLSYQFNGEYEPYLGAGDYDPGDIVSLNVSADLQQEGTTWNANFVYTGYSADKQSGIKALKQGYQFGAALGMNRQIESFGYGAGVSYLVRGRNETYDANDVLLSSLKLYGNEFALRGYASWEPAPKWTVIPTVSIQMIGEPESVSLSLFGPSSAEFGSTSIVAFGAGVGRMINEQFTAEAGFKYHTGSTDGGDIDLTGTQFSLSLSATL